MSAISAERRRRLARLTPGRRRAQLQFHLRRNGFTTALCPPPPCRLHLFQNPLPVGDPWAAAQFQCGTKIKSFKNRSHPGCRQRPDGGSIWLQPHTPAQRATNRGIFELRAHRSCRDGNLFVPAGPRVRPRVKTAERLFHPARQKSGCPCRNGVESCRNVRAPNFPRGPARARAGDTAHRHQRGWAGRAF